MRITADTIPGLRVTVMGLGLHGGGLASAEFFAERGAEVTVTDLRDEKTLRRSVKRLKNSKIRFVLGKHEIDDFTAADLVIKNPAVRPDSPYLSAAAWIESDISIFLQLHHGRVFSVTGTKGKSTVASAMHHIMKADFPETRLGGNITVSPLTFLSVNPDAPVVLELSSWQLADIKGKDVHRPDVALVTNIMRDHQNRYGSMREYIADKMVIFESQQPGQAALINFDDPRLRSTVVPTGVETLYFSRSELPEGTRGGYLSNSSGVLRDGQGEKMVIDTLRLKGEHNRLNMLCAALSCAVAGMKPETVCTMAASFSGIEHRMEFVASKGGVEYYNDSAATMPDATVAASKSFARPVYLICGGTDKELDFAVFSHLAGNTKAVYLLEGDATDKMVPVLRATGVPYKGPFSSLDNLVAYIIKDVEPSDTVVFSPGCASFGMFLNEFERGNAFKSIIGALRT